MAGSFWSIHSPAATNLGRRQLLRSLGAGAALAMGGLPLRTAIAAEDKIAFWATGTLDIGPNWNRLTGATGVSVTFTDNGNDPGPVVAELVGGNGNDRFDVGGIQGGAEAELAARGAIAPWDLSKIPNYASLWAFAKRTPHHYFEGRPYSLPSVLNADSMIYLPEKVGEVDSYGVIFDRALKGRVAMEDTWINSAVFTAMYLKESENVAIEEPGNLSESELGLVMEFLIKNKRDGQFLTFWNGWEHGVDLIAKKDVWAMTGWEPIVKAANRRGVDARYAVPTEGFEGWSNNTILMRGAAERGSSDAAHRLANWMLDGYYGCLIGRMRGYAVPTDNNLAYAKAHPDQFSPDEVEAVSDNVKRKFAGKIYWQNTRPTNISMYDEWWRKLRDT